VLPEISLPLTEPLPDPPPLPPVIAPEPAPPAVSVPDYAVDEDYNPFAHEPPFSPRINKTRRWTIAAFCAALVMLAGIGLIEYFGTPNFAARFGLPVGTVDVPLLIEQTLNPHRADNANGPSYLDFSGRIINPTNQSQRVPDILADLLDSHGRIITTMVVTPPQRTLPPRGVMPFDSAFVNPPVAAKEINLSFSGAR
jgi:hypothetical protein